MAEEQQVSSTEPTPSTGPQTLDDVFKSYSVEKPQQPQPQPDPRQYYQPQPHREPQHQPQQQQEVHIPDPALDPDGFRRYETAARADTQVLRQALVQVAGKLSNMEASSVKQKEEADIRKAVGVLKEKLPDMDEDMLEIAIIQKARKDTRLLEVWNNRDKNPRVWDAALKALANEMQGKFTMRTDPQLAENQRAMKTAQQTMATAQKEASLDEKLGKQQGAAFDRAMDRIRQGMDPGL